VAKYFDHFFSVLAFSFGAIFILLGDVVFLCARVAARGCRAAVAPERAARSSLAPAPEKHGKTKLPAPALPAERSKKVTLTERFHRRLIGDIDTEIGNPAPKEGCKLLLL